jgi:hypothetical protein
VKRKRVEYQKYLRNKLEHETYRKLFGLDENIELEAEEDLVLQREFRIDFVFRKIVASLSLLGIFSYFKTFNLFEFKSVNDPLDIVLLRKYIGELFWWLYNKNGGQLQERDVTLTIMTVRKPINVLKHLQQPELKIDVENPEPGHYRWLVMGIEVHLLVINELEIRPEHYAWLSFAEGETYHTYQTHLSEDISEDETYQIYLDILTELEEEGKERMADEVIARIIKNMSPERRHRILDNLPAEDESIARIIKNMSPERRHRILDNLPAEVGNEVITRIIRNMPPERRHQLLDNLPAEARNDILERFPAQQAQTEALQRILLQQLQAKFGQVSEYIVSHIEQLESEAELSELAQRLITASSLDELGLN